MRRVKLVTREGDIVDYVMTPDFPRMPELIVFGTSYFQQNTDGLYRQAEAYVGKSEDELRAMGCNTSNAKDWF